MTFLTVVTLLAAFWIGWGPETVADVRWWYMRGRMRRAGHRLVGHP